MRQPLFSVIFVLFHGPLNVMEKNIRNTHKESIEYILIDNSESNEYFQSVKLWLSKFPSEIQKQVKIYQAPSNGGYAKGNNIGFKFSKGKYLLICNPDFELGPNFFKIAKKYFDRTNWAILGSKNYYDFQSNKIFSGLIKCQYYSPRFFMRFIEIPRSDNISLKCYETAYVHGGCFLIRKEIYKKLKGFDENFFMYGEESDLCFRAKKKNYKVVYCPELTAAHIQEELSLFSCKLIYQNNIVLSAKNFSSALFFIQFLFSFSRLFFFLIDSKRFYRIKYHKIIPLVKSILKGFLIGLQYRFRPKWW
jgi:GT2 family glycosyltransferase